MNRFQNKLINNLLTDFINLCKRAADLHLRMVAGALLCIVLTGCGGTDKAMSPGLGETVEYLSSAKMAVDGSSAGQSSGIAGQNGASTVGEETMLYVYVCGAVKVPGVVTLPAGSRCNDALEAAGGFAEDADRAAVNLAKLVSDGEQLYFPTVEEAQMAASAEQTSGLVNINTAGVELLCTLPGIGAAKARAIVSYREQNGFYGAVEDIMQVPGIKESAYSQIKDLITVS